MAGTDDHLQNQDVQVLVRGANVPVYVDDDLNDPRGDGWRGGLWVVYSGNTFGDGPTLSKNVRVVSASDGTAGVGFLMRGSEFHPVNQQPGSFDARVSEYNHSSYQPKKTRVVTMCFDGSYIFKMFERYEYPNRDSGTEIAYSLNESLYISERGYLTTEADALAAGIVTPVFAGTCWMVPSEDNHYRLGMDRF